MARSEKHNQMSASEKYVVYKAAYSNVNKYIAEKNYMAANLLAFALIEDRVIAALVACHRAKYGIDNLPFKDVNKVNYSELVREISALGVIDSDLKHLLINAADVRNRQIHEMIWRLNSFTRKQAEHFRSLSYRVSSAQKKYLKANKVSLPKAL